MRNFIFFTRDGYTYDCNNKEISNLQILGTGQGNNIVEAFKDFKFNQSYLQEFSFKKVTALEYIGEFIHNLEL